MRAALCVCLLVLTGCGKSTALKSVDYQQQKLDAEQIAKDAILKLVPDAKFVMLVRPKGEERNIAFATADTPKDEQIVFRTEIQQGGFILVSGAIGTPPDIQPVRVLLRNDMFVLSVNINNKDYDSDEMKKMRLEGH